MNRALAVAMTVVSSVTGIVPLVAEEHPSLYVGPDDRSWILERIERAPFDQWWSAARSSARGGLSFDPTAYPEHHARSPIARDLSFAAWVENDPVYVPKAVEILRDIDPEVGWGEGHRAGASALAYAEAYDFLAGSGFLDPQDDLAIRDRLLATVERMDRNPIIEAIPNNWKIRYFSGAAALCLVTEDGGSGHGAAEVAAWRDASLERVLRTVVIQEIDGAWAEGSHYLSYSASTYIRLFLAWDRRFGRNFLEVGPLTRAHDFVLDWALPSGLTPNVDDASLADFPSGLVAPYQAYPDAHMWSAARDGNWIESEELRIASICAHPEPDAGSPPTWDPDSYSPRAGTAIFRSDWTSDASHLLVMGEHGDARTMGLRHEHADGTSLTLWKGSVPLLLDGGYFSWDGRHLVAGPEHHNLVLVDGKGPAEPTALRPVLGVDAWLSDWVDEDTLGSVVVSTTHHRTEMERSVTHIRHDWVTVVDDAATVSWRARTFTQLLHGNGEEGLGTFESTADGGRWLAEGLELTAQVLAPIGVTFETARDIHSFHYADTTAHTVLRSSMDGWYTRFVVSLVYGPEGEVQLPRVVRGDAGMALSRDEGAGSDVLLVADEPGEGIAVDVPGLGRLESAADRVYLRVRGGRVLDAVVFAGPVEVAVDGCPVMARSSASVHGSLAP